MTGRKAATRDKARELIEADNESRVADLHLWRVGSKDVALIVSVVTGAGRKAAEYQDRLKGLPGPAHISVEVHSRDDPDCPCA